MEFRGVLLIDMVSDVILQSLHVEVNSLKEGGKASGRNSKTFKEIVSVNLWPTGGGVVVFAK
jgi:hypothetical protein